jgi:hypothetical protein
MITKIALAAALAWAPFAHADAKPSAAEQAKIVLADAGPASAPESAQAPSSSGMPTWGWWAIGVGAVALVTVIVIAVAHSSSSSGSGSGSSGGYTY